MEHGSSAAGHKFVGLDDVTHNMDENYSTEEKLAKNMFSRGSSAPSSKRPEEKEETVERRFVNFSFMKLSFVLTRPEKETLAFIFQPFLASPVSSFIFSTLPISPKDSDLVMKWAGAVQTRWAGRQNSRIYYLPNRPKAQSREAGAGGSNWP